MGKTAQTQLTKERKKKIQLRLRNYTVENIKTGVYGCSITPHNMGQNANHKRYDDIELICRTDTHLERFMGYAQQSQGPPRKIGFAGEQTLNMLMNTELKDYE